MSAANARRRDLCECRDGTGLHGCPAPARWLVRAGAGAERKACSRHLARVCDALSRRQGERVTLGLVHLGGER